MAAPRGPRAERAGHDAAPHVTACEWARSGGGRSDCEWARSGGGRSDCEEGVEEVSEVLL